MNRREALRIVQGFGLTIDPVPAERKEWARKHHLPCPRWQLSNGHFFKTLDDLVQYLPKESKVKIPRARVTITRASDLNRLVGLSHLIIPPKDRYADGPQPWSFDSHGRLTTVLVDLHAVDRNQLNDNTRARMGL